jgi:hypothetical protein
VGGVFKSSPWILEIPKNSVIDDNLDAEHHGANHWPNRILCNVLLMRTPSKKTE